MKSQFSVRTQTYDNRALGYASIDFRGYRGYYSSSETLSARVEFSCNGFHKGHSSRCGKGNFMRIEYGLTMENILQLPIVGVNQ